MVYVDICKGIYVNLRSVEENDAVFTARLRSDKDLCKHIHRVDATIEGQKKFIKTQRTKEGDYYFLIINQADIPLGTIALYHIEGRSAELGRWVSYGNAFENVEAVLLLHDLAFERFGMDEVYTCTNVENKKIVGFWKHFGYDDFYVEKQADYIANKSIIKKKTYYSSIRPRIEIMLRY